MATVSFHSHLRRVLGTTRIEVDAPTVAALLDQLAARFGEAFTSRMSACKIIVNGNNVAMLRGKSTPLDPGDEVAILPPIAGG